MADSGDNAKGFEFRKFATPRIVGGIAILVVVLWAMTIIFGSSKEPASPQSAHRQDPPAVPGSPTKAATADHSPAASGAAGHAVVDTAGAARSPGQASAPAQGNTTTAGAAADRPSRPAAGAAAARQSTVRPQPAAESVHGAASERRAAAPAANQHGITAGPLVEADAPAIKPAPKGAAFVEAAIEPLRYELEDRWWGWRPNDIVDLTDNVNNFQMGVLEVTRRTTVALAERISRTGVTDALDPNLEDAMNWFMVKASSYWFPSAESKYREGLKELEAYLNRLKNGRATFYTRTDNLIPLLSSFEDLLGSCDENLVKQVNEDGSQVSIFNADDYFFYTRGVASSMATVLEAVHHDFLLTLESRHATELLHHAIVSCQRAAELDPWIILDRNLSSIFANHRANMAAPISHARFYLGQLIKTLST
ncbi:MAG TPA: DUF2333 family protein [Desulfosarcina sp.]|nr:DUF2333 family protein [Desulfosarcina sp.]